VFFLRITSIKKATIAYLSKIVIIKAYLIASFDFGAHFVEISL